MGDVAKRSATLWSDSTYSTSRLPDNLNARHLTGRRKPLDDKTRSNRHVVRTAKYFHSHDALVGKS